MDTRKQWIQNAKRVVVKVGSGVLTQKNGLNLKTLTAISADICHLIEKGLEIILVSSGAMAVGMRKLKIDKRPDEIPKRQAIAAIGQAGLMMEYETVFAGFNKKAAQILLTRDDLSNRKRYLNARNTLYTLLSWNVIPIINENDTVVIDELKFGDNDNLSAMIALLTDADLLINLTDIDGLFTKNPHTYPDAQFISEVETINKKLENMASAIPGALGTGGMLSKIKAAKKLTSAGMPMIIANGKKKHTLNRIFEYHEIGTLFFPKKIKLSRRKCWIGYSVKPTGIIKIDEGATKAICARGKSLLPSGIFSCVGEFKVGSPVEIRDHNNNKIGIGLVNYAVDDIIRIMGKKTSEIEDILGYKSYDEIIHRNNLTITS